MEKSSVGLAPSRDCRYAAVSISHAGASLAHGRRDAGLDNLAIAGDDDEECLSPIQTMTPEPLKVSQWEATIMVYRGHVENGTIRLEGSVVLPEGVEVRVEVATAAKEEFEPNAPTIEEKLHAAWADVPKEEWDRLPVDLTEHLDHYIYGTPK